MEGILHFSTHQKPGTKIIPYQIAPNQVFPSNEMNDVWQFDLASSTWFWLAGDIKPNYQLLSNSGLNTPVARYLAYTPSSHFNYISYLVLTCKLMFC